MYKKDKGFGEFYDATHSALYRYAKGRMGTDNMIEDILQETYYEAYKSREKLKSHPNPVGWLYKTANFIVHNQQRRKDTQVISLELLAETADNLCTYGGYELIEWKLMVQEMLSETESKLIYLYYYERRSSAEIAALYGITRENVRVKLCRIRRKMKEKMRGDDWAETQESYYLGKGAGQ